MNINTKNFFPITNKIRRESRVSIWQAIKGFWFFFREIRLIEKMEEKAAHLRPREEKKGETDQILVENLNKLSKIHKVTDLKNLEREVFNKFSKVNLKKDEKVLKIGLIGEIYTVVDGSINLDLEKRLGQMEVEVHRQMNLFYHLKKTVSPWIDWKIQKKIMPYLKSTVGGHGRDAIYEMLEYSKKNFDGVIQLLPFGCMPETTVRPILQRISKEKNIPFISFSIDEQTGEVGITTRLEAFIDLIKSRKRLIS
jgi:predicted nucleotide-binding protein (sugar kinase/HSP70/actin superfamily)